MLLLLFYIKSSLILSLEAVRYIQHAACTECVKLARVLCKVVQRGVVAVGRGLACVVVALVATGADGAVVGEVGYAEVDVEQSAHHMCGASY